MMRPSSIPTAASRAASSTSSTTSASTAPQTKRAVPPTRRTMFQSSLRRKAGGTLSSAASSTLSLTSGASSKNVLDPTGHIGGVSSTATGSGNTSGLEETEFVTRDRNGALVFDLDFGVLGEVRVPRESDIKAGSTGGEDMADAEADPDAMDRENEDPEKQLDRIYDELRVYVDATKDDAWMFEGGD